MEEIWKVYKDSTYNVTYRHGKYITRKSAHGALFEVSNFGRVKKNGELIKLSEKYIINSGYYMVGRFLIHRAVAELFLPNPYNKKIVDHIDTNRLNNRVDNLRWVTATENNLNYNTRLKRLGQKRTEEQKRNIANGTRIAELGRKWFNDGEREFFIYPNDKLLNYKDGRLFRHRKKKKM